VQQLGRQGLIRTVLSGSGGTIRRLGGEIAIARFASNIGTRNQNLEVHKEDEKGKLAKNERQIIREERVSGKEVQEVLFLGRGPNLYSKTKGEKKKR